MKKPFVVRVGLVGGVLIFIGFLYLLGLFSWQSIWTDDPDLKGKLVSCAVWSAAAAGLSGICTILLSAATETPS